MLKNKIAPVQDDTATGVLMGIDLQLFAEGEGDPPAGDPPADPPAAAPNPPSDPPSQTPPAATPPVGAPEQYTDYKLPEGMTFDKEQASKFNEVAKGLNLTQDQAQKLVDYYSGTVQASTSAHTKTVEQWTAESTKTYGKEGIEQANRALGHFSSPEFVQYLKDTGLGNHPQMIGVFKSIYAKIGEDGFVDTNNNSGGKGNPLSNNYDALYPSMKDFRKR